MIAEGIEASTLHGCPYFLIDLRNTTSAVPNHAIYEFASELGKVGLERTMVLAMVYGGDEEQHRFAETVVRNRGWYGIRFFPDYGAAEEWIREGRSIRTDRGKE